MTVFTNKITARLIDTSNGDLKVVNAARVSFAKESNEILPGDVGLINYLANHRHWTPFSHCRDTFEFKVPTPSHKQSLLEFLLLDLNQDDITSMVVAQVNSSIFVKHSLFGWANILNKCALSHKIILREDLAKLARALCDKYPLSSAALLTPEAKSIFANVGVSEFYTDYIDDRFEDITLCEYVPIFVARQRFKHMVGTTYNEVSRRYVSTPPQLYLPDIWRGKHESAKQGSTDEPSEFMHGRKSLNHNVVATEMHNTVDKYNTMIKNGVCPEQARMTLPQGMMTEYYVTANRSAWNRMIEQRKDSHAQKEIRDLAIEADKIINKVKE